MAAPPPCDRPAIDAVEQALVRGNGDAARTALDLLLAGRAEAGDPLAALTLRVLAQGRFAPDAMAATVDRLLALVRAQEDQIRTLQAMLDS